MAKCGKLANKARNCDEYHPQGKYYVRCSPPLQGARGCVSSQKIIANVIFIILTFHRVDGLCHLWLWSGPVITRHVRSRHSVTHVTCHEDVTRSVLIMITITTSHLLAAAAGGWLRPTVAIFSLLFSPAVLCLYIANNYTFTFSFCVLVSFFIILTHVSFDGCQINFVVVKIIINIMFTFN